ncbi:uncharacterized protein AMSG_09311 [Thecamonas trahens ATCC 50062]|uniref:Uncharacterized protein n=1 Tax=Thecamonas trahens ATCC 50062 TaxID=461836 RepID=A0A0L0DLN8_THETB|nr:hypothetical protein AMSG_09311 [Thecamonas trahens ATCC 50062]KNC53224.1 hypothetical protein AMSG_09311 [Thecamonas trahens ATCC 50062]|eukprot:XP_013754693.1 hypothetical protein AMSG_09311 [Thecamonas trahens ATCC 50062]
MRTGIDIFFNFINMFISHIPSRDPFDAAINGLLSGTIDFHSLSPVLRGQLLGIVAIGVSSLAPNLADRLIEQTRPLIGQLYDVETQEVAGFHMLLYIFFVGRTNVRASYHLRAADTLLTKLRNRARASCLLLAAPDQVAPQAFSQPPPSGEEVWTPSTRSIFYRVYAHYELPLIAATRDFPLPLDPADDFTDDDIRTACLPHNHTGPLPSYIPLNAAVVSKLVAPVRNAVLAAAEASIARPPQLPRLDAILMLICQYLVDPSITVLDSWTRDQGIDSLQRCLMTMLATCSRSAVARPSDPSPEQTARDEATRSRLTAAALRMVRIQRLAVEDARTLPPEQTAYGAFTALKVAVAAVCVIMCTYISGELKLSHTVASAALELLLLTDPSAFQMAPYAFLFPLSAAAFILQVTGDKARRASCIRLITEYSPPSNLNVGVLPALRVVFAAILEAENEPAQDNPPVVTLPRCVSSASRVPSIPDPTPPAGPAAPQQRPVHRHRRPPAPELDKLSSSMNTSFIDTLRAAGPPRHASHSHSTAAPSSIWNQ